MDINKLNKRIELKGYELLFYINENSKYTVQVVGDAKATEKLLAACKHKSVKPERLYFFIKGIKGKIAAGVLPDKKAKYDALQEPLIKLNEYCQKNWQQKFRTKFIEKVFFMDPPGARVAITLPNGFRVSAFGENQKQAERIAARMILNMINEQK